MVTRRSDTPGRGSEGAVRGRGRPRALVADGPTGELLGLIAQGATVAEACAELGLSRKPVYTRRGDDRQFAAALKEAQAAGARARRAALGAAMDRCGTEARYVKAECRCAPCTAAAGAARARRREVQADSGPVAAPVPLGRSQSTSERQRTDPAAA